MKTVSRRNLLAVLEKQWRHYARKRALLCPDTAEEFTYQQLSDYSARMARFLHSQGARAGKPLLISLPNGPVEVVVILGAIRLGALPCVVDSALSRTELSELRERCAAPLVVSDVNREGCLNNPISSISSLIIDSPVGFPGGGRQLDRMLDGIEPLAKKANPHPQSPAALVHTSGTTGLSKVVAINHKLLIERWGWSLRKLGLDDSFSFLCLLPFAHSFFYPGLASFFVGGSLILCPPFSVKIMPKLGKWIGEGANTIHLIPPLVRLLIQAHDRFELSAISSLRFATCTSAPLAPETIRSFESVYGIRLLNCYGLKETGYLALTSPEVSRRDLAAVGETEPGRVRILSEEGRPLSAGTIGEIAVRRERGFYYWHDRKANARRFRGKWFMTGDRGSIDRFGRLYLSGRVGEVININGRKVDPAMVESVLLGHEAILEATVLGIPDSLSGERVVACIVPHNGFSISESDLQRYCFSILADYQTPSRFLFARSLPKAGLEKVRRQALRHLFLGSDDSLSDERDKPLDA